MRARCAMTENEKREKLLRFLDQHAFDPILERSPNEFSGAAKTKFQEVRRSTESEQKRFHDHYKTAREVRDNYLSDLSSHTGEKKSRELKELGLPTMPQFKEEFL